MIAAQKWQIRAAEYRRLATESLVLAEASVLDHVREKHELASIRWTDLAALDEARSEDNLALTLQPKATPLPPPGKMAIEASRRRAMSIFRG